MKPSEIITADSQNRGVDPDQALRSIHALIATKRGFLVQEGDSVVFLMLIGPGQYDVHLFTQDSPLRLAGSMVKIMEKIEKMKIKAIYGMADNPQIMQLMKTLADKEGFEFEKSDKPNYNWMIHL